jgi:maltose O-acetyltransferase
MTSPASIGYDVWLGAAVLVLPGVTIGDRSVVAAGAVVSEDVPPDSGAVGIPARVIRSLA